MRDPLDVLIVGAGFWLLKLRMKTIFKIGAICLALMHLLTMFSPLVPGWLMSLASAAVLIPGLSLISSGFKKATIIFLVLGAALLLATKQPLTQWISAWNSMTNTVAIMVAMQLIAIPVSMGRYDESICGWAERRVRSNRPLFAFSNVITHLLASFLNMGAIPLSMNLMGKTIRSRMPQNEADRFIAITLSRGYVLAALWAPPAINLYLVVQATGVAWSALLLPGIVLALIGFGLSYWMETWKGGIIRDSALECAELARRADCAAADERSITSGQRERGKFSHEDAAIFHVVLVAASIVGIVFILEKLGVGQAYTRIMLAGIIVTLVWTLLLFDKTRFVAALQEYWDDGILKVRDMGPFFVAMGIFSGALESSGILKLISPSIQAAASWLGILSVAVLPLIMIALSVVGFHPFITIVLFGKILAATPMPLPILSIALSLAVGGAAAYMISPFAGIIMSISRYTGAKASQISVRWNGKYSIAFFFIGVIFSVGWGTIVGH